MLVEEALCELWEKEEDALAVFFGCPMRLQEGQSHISCLGGHG